MADVAERKFPEHFYYDLDNQIWYQPLESGDIRVGFTPIAIELAGEVLAFTPKRVGKDFESQRSFATIECGKWVGAARAAFKGVVVEVNENLIKRPRLLNTDAFGEAWMLVVKSSEDGWHDKLIKGPEVAEAFAAWLKSESYKNRAS